MTPDTKLRILTALHLIQGQAALIEAQFPGALVPSLPLHLAADELTEALKLEGGQNLLAMATDSAKLLQRNSVVRPFMRRAAA